MRNAYRSAHLLPALAIALAFGASAAQAKDSNCSECWLGKSSLTQDKSPEAQKQDQQQDAPAADDKVAVAAPAKGVGPDKADDQGDGPLKALGGDNNGAPDPADDLPKAADAVGDGKDDPADDQVAQVVDDKGKGKPKKSHGTDETEGRSDHRGGNSGSHSNGGNGGGHNADGSPK